MRCLPVALILALSLVLAGDASAKKPAPLIGNGEHLCKVSKEYKLRKCRVVQEGDGQVLSVYDEGHLLQLEGVLYRNDFVGKSKKVFFEAKITGDQPYNCNVRDAAAAKACRAQVVMVSLEKKGGVFVGSFPLKMYWDRWVGDGEQRRIDGFEVTVEDISFTLKPGK